MKYMARQAFVDVDLLRAVVGIYMHGAQLNRDLMTIPYVIYHMIEKCEGEVVRMWPSVRRELQSMSSGVVFMQCQVSRTFTDVRSGTMKPTSSIASAQATINTSACTKD